MIVIILKSSLPLHNYTAIKTYDVGVVEIVFFEDSKHSIVSSPGVLSGQYVAIVYE